MRRIPSALLSAGVLAVALTGLAAPAAQAQTAKPATATWTVTPGGVSEAVSTSTPVTTLTDTVTGAKFRCSTLFVAAYFDKGSGLPSRIGWVKSMEGTGPCTGNGLTLSLAGGMSASDSWPVRANSYDAATNTAYGSIHGVDLTLSGTGCTANLTGSMNWSLQNSNDSAWDPKSSKTLTAANVSGCTGVISNGDTFNYTGIRNRLVGQRDRNMTITSP